MQLYSILHKLNSQYQEKDLLFIPIRHMTQAQIDHNHAA